MEIDDLMMNRLVEIGFTKVGEWKLIDGELNLILTHELTCTNCLYAFIYGQQVFYIGKTTQTLVKRLNGYLKPGVTQSTNIRNRSNIIKLLQYANVVDVYCKPDDGMFKYGEFTINLAAGLEDALIEAIKPLWNKR